MIDCVVPAPAQGTCPDSDLPGRSVSARILAQQEPDEEEEEEEEDPNDGEDSDDEDGNDDSDDGYSERTVRRSTLGGYEIGSSPTARALDSDSPEAFTPTPGL